MRAKAKTRSILHEAGVGPEEWPLAARLAAHGFRNQARRRLNMPVLPSVPFNAKVQVLQRSWNRGVWESLTVTALTKAPSGDTTRGWIVKTHDGKLLTTGSMFPLPPHEQELEIKCKGEPIPVSEPERRIRGKTSLRHLQVLWEQSEASSPGSEVEARAKQAIDCENFSIATANMLLHAVCHELKA